MFIGTLGMSKYDIYVKISVILRRAQDDILISHTELVEVGHHNLLSI